MEQKMTTIPFDVELAKKIQAGEHPGKIVTRDDKGVRILCFDAFNAYPLVVLIKSINSEYSVMYNEVGKASWADETELPCDLVLQVPEWTQFKDGDILACETSGLGNFCKWFSVLKGKVSHEYNYEQFNSYVSYDYDSSYASGRVLFDDYSINVISIRLATDEEKQRFAEVLKTQTDPRAKECLKRFFGIEEKEEYKLEPFDKVLVRDSLYDKWSCELFSHYDTEEAQFVCIGTYSIYCIPYNDQTKHLLGTTKGLEE